MILFLILSPFERWRAGAKSGKPMFVPCSFSKGKTRLKIKFV